MGTTLEREIPYARSAILRLLPPDDIETLRPRLHLAPLDVDNVIYEAGAPIHYVYFPIAGMITLLQKVDDRQTIDVAAIGADGVLGAIIAYGVANSPCDAVVQVAGDSLIATAADFLNVFRTSQILRHIIGRSHAAMLVQAQQIAACNAVHSVEQRMCRWLLQIHQHVGSDILPITQDAMAHMLGVQRTTVTLVEQRLQSAGVVRQRRGRVEILDLGALQACACQCETRIKRMHENASAVASGAPNVVTTASFVSSPPRLVPDRVAAQGRAGQIVG